MCNATSRLVLGTAQLGMKYGVANTLGQPSTHVSQKIIDTAVEQGIVCFDTAVAYG